jgi:hypothetical protein
MSDTSAKIIALVRADDWRASDHAVLRMEEHAIIATDLVDSIASAEVIEDYPIYHAGPCSLLLQSDRDGPVHVLWGLKLGTDRPAVIITAYRPNPKQWHDDNRTRKP